MANSRCGNGSVEPKEMILTKNDKITKFVEDILDFSNMKKGGAKRGRQRSIGTAE